MIGDIHSWCKVEGPKTGIQEDTGNLNPILNYFLYLVTGQLEKLGLTDNDKTILATTGIIVLDKPSGESQPSGVTDELDSVTMSGNIRLSEEQLDKEEGYLIAENFRGGIYYFPKKDYVCIPREALATFESARNTSNETPLYIFKPAIVDSRNDFYTDDIEEISNICYNSKILSLKEFLEEIKSIL